MRSLTRGVQKIETQALSIEGFQIPVPIGLSELLQNCWSSRKSDKPALLKSYTRNVYQDENGLLVSEYRKLTERKEAEAK